MVLPIAFEFPVFEWWLLFYQLFSVNGSKGNYRVIPSFLREEPVFPPAAWNKGQKVNQIAENKYKFLKSLPCIAETMESFQKLSEKMSEYVWRCKLSIN